MCPQNKQRLLPYTTVTDDFYNRGGGVFTAWYGLGPYITRIRFVFKGLNLDK